ncbi:protein PXR1-like [Rosa chinensis]|uniref:protein PXR1-like n=1 Tax=Rosa chinensis TaxID=74649 RepID=UPI000D08E2ED|nr:protein PXR1-like [Rosa chinensis]
MACTIDFSCLDEDFGGKTYERRRNLEVAADYEDAAMKIDAAYPPPVKRSAVSSSDKPVFGRPSYDVVIAGKVSGRKWKQPRKQRSSAVQVSRKGTTFEEREKNKSVKKAYKERMAEPKGEIKRNKEEKRRKREEREKKKKENILKTGSKLQIISKKRVGVSK